MDMVAWDLKSKMTVLARTSNNLPDQPIQKWQVREIWTRVIQGPEPRMTVLTKPAAIYPKLK
jgi:hypothetical protein